MDAVDAVMPMDDNTLRRFVQDLLPSVRDFHIKRFNGTLIMAFDALDDFVAASIGASSANIVATVFNTFEGKHAIPKTIASCSMRLELTPGLTDARLAFFFMELALLRKADGTLPESSFRPLNRELHGIESLIRAGEDAQ